MEKYDFFDLILDDNEPYLFTHFCKKNLIVAQDFYLYIKDKFDINHLLGVLDGASRLENSQEVFDFMQKEIKELVYDALDKNLENELFKHQFFYYYVENYTNWIHFYKHISQEQKEEYVLNFLNRYLSEVKVISEKEFLFIQDIFKDKKDDLPINVLVRTNYTQELLDLGFSSKASMRSFINHAYSNSHLPDNFFEIFYDKLDLFEQHDFKDAVMANQKHLFSLDKELTKNTISILKAMNVGFNYTLDLMSDPEEEILTLSEIFHQSGQKPMFKLEDYLEHAMSLEQIGLFDYHIDLIDKLLEMTHDMPDNEGARLKKLYNYIQSYGIEQESEYLFTDSMKENFLVAIEKAILNVTLKETELKKSIVIKL
jgi:hypothetical protein